MEYNCERHPLVDLPTKRQYANAYVTMSIKDRMKISSSYRGTAVNLKHIVYWKKIVKLGHCKLTRVSQHLQRLSLKSTKTSSQLINPLEDLEEHAITFKYST